jgi:Tol biopolymer transport system component
MTPDRSVDERISAWLLDAAPDQLPDRVLQATFARTLVSGQRRRLWLRRETRMPRTTRMIAVGAAAILIVVGGLVLYPRSGPSVASTPTSTPAASDASPTGTPAGSLDGSTAPTAAAAMNPASLGGEIAFHRTTDGNTDIYLTSDGTHVERLTTDPAEDSQMAWSPDGTTLLIGRRTSLDPELSNIYKLDMATHVERRLTSGGGAHAGPVVSPDGNRIAYERWPVDSGLHVMDLDGSNDRLAYPTHDDQWNLQSSWASNAAVYVKHGDFDLLVVDLDTGKATPIVSGGSQLGDVALSPDRSTFAFRSRRAGGGLFLMDVDGSNVRRIMESNPKGGLAWAPDGKHLILAEPDGWLYLVDLEGETMIRLGEGADAAPRPSR